jgi:hypothetical protein
MTERFDIITPRKRKDGKTFWLKIGAGFNRDKGGFSLVLDALPLPDETGRIGLLMVPPSEKGSGGGDVPVQAAAGGARGIDDEIPF